MKFKYALCLIVLNLISKEGHAQYHERVVSQPPTRLTLASNEVGSASENETLVPGQLYYNPRFGSQDEAKTTPGNSEALVPGQPYHNPSFGNQSAIDASKSMPNARPDGGGALQQQSSLNDSAAAKPEQQSGIEKSVTPTTETSDKTQDLCKLLKLDNQEGMTYEQIKFMLDNNPPYLFMPPSAVKELEKLAAVSSPIVPHCKNNDDGKTATFTYTYTNPNTFTEATTSSITTAGKVDPTWSEKKSICSAVKRMLGWGEGEESSFQDIKSILSTIPDRYVITPDFAVTEILNITAVDKMISHCTDSDEDSTAKIYFTYTRDGQQGETPALNVMIKGL